MTLLQAHRDSIAGELKLQARQVEAVAALLGEAATVPFIARYRKERTGSLDEVAVMAIRDRLTQLEELEKRRETILESLKERNLLEPALERSVRAAATLTELEDVYLPHRPKRRTRAAVARERGLEPLADRLMLGGALDVAAAARAFVKAEAGVDDVEAALAGARDILAERVSEDARARAGARSFFSRQGMLQCVKARGADEEKAAKYRDYFEWSEEASRAPSHRILAMLRGEREKCLSLAVRPPVEGPLGLLLRMFVKGSGPGAEQVRLAVEDGYDRLLAPSLETETRQALLERAEREAIRVFAGNLRELLLASPLGRKRVLALDPGFRTGCKLVCLDAQGTLLHHETIFPHSGPGQAAQATERLRELCSRFQIEAVAVGNGTAGRETETFARAAGLPESVPVVMVNESGASIYSASEVAREEFPDLDLTVRGAVSIGRRLMDPLAELVKLEPESLGVGQYQHDVNAKALKESLVDVVTSCVNAVGVEVNTASRQLLAYVSGVGPGLAAALVKFRSEKGAFRSRKDLLKVPRLGPKAFEQAAGFLRIHGADNPLDASAVHPESYGVVEAMARSEGCGVFDLIRDEARRGRIVPDRYVSDTVGLPTLRDILAELSRPGRDPRREYEVFRFDDTVHALEDLRPGMKLPGIVTNVTAFGAFVDVGVHQDGLIHVSQLADRFVKDPAEIVKVAQRVQVTVVEVDAARKRIALSMKANPVVRQKS
ncbi:MAG: RNA-binding transcriptional accessory protein [Candidatus Wallbacteria bacterium]|nr:RNA-binding transcriptional accessory protein [Candidatus Wallbacteria bacterium]